jgi:pyruvate dehydrogenase E2 component (dihydrolipoamide acetyltransferase)
MSEISMPRLSESMEEGTILKWLKASGEPVREGEDLVEIETDKAAMTYAAEAAGTLEIVAPEGATLAVGTLIARLGEGGSVAPRDAADSDAAHAPEPPVTAAPLPAPAAPAAPVGSGRRSQPTSNGHRAATPLAQRAAQAHGIELEALAGSGPRGRITRADVLAAAGLDRPAAAPSSAPSAHAPAAAPAGGGAPGAPGARGESRHEALTRRQQVVARRMAEAKATIPEFEVQTEVAMDAAVALRVELRELAPEEARPSVNDLIVKACAIALTRHPRVNASYTDAAFELHTRVNVGVAVAAEDALVVPTVFDADTKSLVAIAGETRRLAERVRSGQITPPELSGGTFTVSNLGMFGMTAIHPVINPPQAAILGVGSMRPTLARVDGAIIDRTLMTLTLVGDHRILYGADGARFLAEVRDLLQTPLALLL